MRALLARWGGGAVARAVEGECRARRLGSAQSPESATLPLGKRASRPGRARLGAYRGAQNIDCGCLGLIQGAWVSSAEVPSARALSGACYVSQRRSPAVWVTQYIQLSAARCGRGWHPALGRAAGALGFRRRSFRGGRERTLGSECCNLKPT